MMSARKAGQLNSNAWSSTCSGNATVVVGVRVRQSQLRCWWLAHVDPGLPPRRRHSLISAAALFRNETPQKKPTFIPKTTNHHFIRSLILGGPKSFQESLIKLLRRKSPFDQEKTTSLSNNFTALNLVISWVVEQKVSHAGQSKLQAQ